MDRKTAAAVAQDTLAIIDAGELALDGRRISIRDRVAAAVAGTVEYPPDAAVADGFERRYDTTIEVCNETTSAAARRLTVPGCTPAALSFASAKHPGGGFIGGARAQEESLARSSALYACLKNARMYALHLERPDPMYTSYAIYSPAVPVFRDDDGRLIEPFDCAFVTSPAVNAKVVLEREAWRKQDVEDEMARRVRKVLAIAAAHGHDTLILGAWGCGVFGNDPAVIARQFKDALGGEFDGVFRHVTFAITDGSKERRFIAPFEREFAHAAG